MQRFLKTSSRKIVYNTAAQLFGKFFTTAVALITTAFITRTLGKAGYGEFTFIMTVPALLFVILDFGANAIVVREIAGEEEREEKFLKNLLALRLVFSVLLFIAGVALVAFYLKYSRFQDPLLVQMGAFIALLTLFTQSVYLSSNTIFQNHFRYDLSVFSLIFGVFATLAFVIFGFLKGFGVLYFVGSSVLGAVVTALLIFFAIKRLGHAISLGFDRDTWRFLILSSLPLGLMLIFSQISFKADTFMLGALSLPRSFGLTNEETLGVYGLAYKVFENAIIIPTFFMNAAYPLLVKDYKNNIKDFVDKFGKVWVSLLGIGVLVSFTGIIFAPLVVRILGGEGFTQSIFALRLLFVGVPLFFISSPIQWYLVTVRKQAVLPVIYGLGALSNISANWYFIPQYSYQASAVATWVSELVVFLSLLVVFIPLWRKMGLR